MKRASLALAAVLLSVACGKKGPPLPPLVKLAAAPGDFTASRRGDTVDLQFTVPATNTDATRPANVERVDVYAWTGAADASDLTIIKHGEKVASVQVKAPKDPSQTVEPDEPTEDVEAPEGPGLDQGAIAHVRERLAAPVAAEGAPMARTYLVVPSGRKGRRGAMSKRVSVPLVTPPPAPAPPVVTYDEQNVIVTWAPNQVLVLSYNVYEVPKTGAEIQLTKTPVVGVSFADPRVAIGESRCYAVRAVLASESLTVESEERDAVCATFKDTFAPAPPKGLQALPGEAAISLIWDASPEKDLDGYLVLRGATPTSMAVITPALLHETTFSDGLASGTHYFYAVQAVDKTGNIGVMSMPVEETAR